MTTDGAVEARLAALRARRPTAPGAGPIPAGPPIPGPRRRSPLRRRRHVARDARRLSTGAVATGVLALVAVMGLGRAATAPDPVPAPAVAPAAVVPQGGTATPTGSVAVPQGDGRPTTSPAAPDTTVDGSSHGSR